MSLGGFRGPHGGSCPTTRTGIHLRTPRISDRPSAASSATKLHTAGRGIRLRRPSRNRGLPAVAGRPDSSWIADHQRLGSSTTNSDLGGVGRQDCEIQYTAMEIARINTNDAFAGPHARRRGNQDRVRAAIQRRRPVTLGSTWRSSDPSGCTGSRRLTC